MKYLDWPEHKSWLNHYFTAREGVVKLAFARAWGLDNLPADSTSKGLDCILLDTQDNKEYHCKIYTAYEQGHHEIILDRSTYLPQPYWALMDYWYSSHHCPCHRKQDAQSAGAVVENDECEGRRFLLKEVNDPKSKIILLSEVYTEEQLETLLCNNPNAR